MFHAVQEDESAAFKYLPFLAAELPVQISVDFIDGPVDDGDDVIGIMNHIHLGKHTSDRLEVCRPHVHCHSTELGSFSLQFFQEEHQCRRIYFLMGMQNCAGLQIDDHGHILMTSPGGKCVDDKVANPQMISPLESRGKVFFVDGLDHVPPDIKDAGHMLDRGDGAQVDHDSIEGLQPSLLSFGEVNGFLQITATPSTLLEMAIKSDELFAPPHPVARQCQRMRKITRRRHGHSPFVSWLATQQERKSCLGGEFSISESGGASLTSPLSAYARRASSSGHQYRHDNHSSWHLSDEPWKNLSIIE